jgi:hypothetical protein
MLRPSPSTFAGQWKVKFYTSLLDPIKLYGEIIYIRIYILQLRLPLWSSGQSSWLKIQRSRFDFQQYQIFWEVVGLERSPLRLVCTPEELLEKKNSSSGLEN